MSKFNKLSQKARLKLLQALLRVDICEAKPNPLFTESQRQAVRFLRYNKFIRCAACGKKAKVHWTMLLEFKAADMSGKGPRFSMRYYPQTFPPLTPVCSDHPLSPACV